MDNIIITLNIALLLILCAYSISNHIKYRKVMHEIEELRFENSKLSFRLFVAEKKQNVVS